MEENWKRFVKVFNDKLVFNDAQHSYLKFFFTKIIIKMWLSTNFFIILVDNDTFF
jgi:hypothetical protein